ncbi:hypothetical protein PLICRDRAFT_320170 [Plicaturopsis crispa FD-325 SS-3]|nr:hypothetical protein PLICRDRAFT_320170 [Plicaturopsis crispa FD-325 SS-3]
MSTPAVSVLSFLRRAATAPAPPPGATPVTDKTIAQARNKDYPQQVWVLFAGFLSLVTVLQLASFLHSRFARKSDWERAADLERRGGFKRHPLSLSRLPLAVVNVYRVLAFRTTISFGGSYSLNLAEVFLTMAYMAALFTWEFINTTSLSGQVLMVSYWSNRAGFLATSQFPLIVALGTKNNIVSLITGVSFDKLNYLHRMTARVTFVLLWVHAGSKIAAGIEKELPFRWLQLGVMAVAAFTVLCIISLRPIRAASFEIFFYAHFILVLIFLVGAFYHTSQFKFQSWIIASFAIWGADRLTRVVRMIWFTRSSGAVEAITELLADNLVRVRMPRPANYHWSAGQAAYIVMPGVSTLPFEAHPFTIASYDSSGVDGLARGEALGMDSYSSSKNLSDATSPSPFWKEIVFVIQTHKGFTKRLGEVAARRGSVKVLLDGPYGKSPDLGASDTVVLVAGETGVTYTLPVFLDTIENVRHGLSSCRKLVWIWAIRDEANIEWISKTLSRALLLAPSSLEISIRFYITRGRGYINAKPAAPLPPMPHMGFQGNDSNFTVDSTNWEKFSESSHSTVGAPGGAAITNFPAVRVHSGRPDMRQVLLEEAEATSGRMSVSVCGSQSLARAVREGLRFPAASPANIMRGGPSITLNVEAFGYA